jgi:hypothetical protein
MFLELTIDRDRPVEVLLIPPTRDVQVGTFTRVRYGFIACRCQKPS